MNIYEIKNISFAYPHTEKNVLNNVCFELTEGGVLSVLGRNGSGKSTLFGCMLGMMKPQSGEILLDGKSIGEMNGREISSFVGYVPQNSSPSFAFTVTEFVLMGYAPQTGLFSKPGAIEREGALEAMRELGIEALAEKPYTEISGGERQKAVIARAIVTKPRVLLFDEPTAHLDYGSQLLVLKIIKTLSGKGYTVAITTHNPDHALLLGGRAALLDDGGTMVSGETAQIVTRENLSRIYQADVRLEYIESVGRTVCIYSNL